MKKYLPLLLIAFALILSGCQKKNASGSSTEAQKTAGARLLINQLDQSKRPFVILAQHSSGRLLTFFIANTKAVKTATVDLEYLSGDLLKGARSTLETPIKDPFAEAFLLGSCSAGGKCSFDKDLLSGSLKLKLKVEGEPYIHVLKGDYSFVDGETTSSDGRLTYTPQGGSSGQILMNTLGFPQKIDGETKLYPIAITSISQQPIKGKLLIRKKGIKRAVIYDGSDYQDIKADIGAEQTVIKLDQVPRQKSVDITRDDLGEATQEHTFYILGPIILLDR